MTDVSKNRGPNIIPQTVGSLFAGPPNKAALSFWNDQMVGLGPSNNRALGLLLGL